MRDDVTMNGQNGSEILQQVNGTTSTFAKNGNGMRADRAGSTSSNGMGSASVSMLILDHGSADEDGLSLLNGNVGDVNHKVWLPNTSTPAAKDAYTDYGVNKKYPKFDHFKHPINDIIQSLIKRVDLNIIKN